MDITQTYNYLGDSNVFINIALVTGFIHTLRCMPFLESPLSSLCMAIIVAFIYRFFATILVDISPIILVPLLSIILILSCVYYIFLKKRCYENVNIKQYNNGNTLCVDLDK